MAKCKRHDRVCMSGLSMTAVCVQGEVRRYEVWRCTRCKSIGLRGCGKDRVRWTISTSDKKGA